MPVSGFHSTIDSPDSVSLVAPPTTSVMNISTATAMSHHLTWRSLTWRSLLCCELPMRIRRLAGGGRTI